MDYTLKYTSSFIYSNLAESIGSGAYPRNAVMRVEYMHEPILTHIQALGQLRLVSSLMFMF